MFDYKYAFNYLVFIVLLVSLSGCGEESSAPVSQPVRKSTHVKKKPTVPVKGEEKIEEEEKYVWAYDPSGKKDPFLPLVTDESEEDDADGSVGDKQGVPLTPLQRFELSQLKLVAVMDVAGKGVAMVEDPDGKGHTLYVGTLIGKNWGKIVSIEKNKVLVEEKTRKGGRIKELIMKSGEAR